MIRQAMTRKGTRSGKHYDKPKMSVAKTKDDETKTSVAKTKDVAVMPGTRMSRTLRSDTAQLHVPCYHYGKDRHFLYPSYFMCSQCDLYDNEVHTSQRKISPTSKRYACKAKHKNWVFPTDKSSVTPFLLTAESLRVHGTGWPAAEHDPGCVADTALPTTIEDDFSMSTESVLDLDIESHGELAMMRKSIMTLKASVETLSEQVTEGDNEIVHLRLQMANMAHTISRLRSKVRRSDVVDVDEACPTTRPKTSRPTTPKTSSKTKEENILASIRDAIADSVTERRMSNEDNINKHIANAVWNVTFHNGGVMLVLLERAKAYLRQNVYSPWKVLRAMDRRGGVLNMEGLEVLRYVETDGKKYYRGSILPCSADLKRVAAILERGAQQAAYYPLHASRTLSGAECLNFDYGKVLIGLLKAFHLYEAAKQRPISIAVSIDAANLTKYLSHTTAGIKITDYAACDPETGRPLLAGDPSTIVAQSSYFCFPTKIVAEGETKAVFEQFKDHFGYYNDLTLQDKTELPDIQPIKLTIEADMSADWKGLQRGGAAKVCIHPCHCCGILSADLVKANASPCTRWCQQNALVEDVGQEDRVGNKKCYHHDLVDDDRLKQVILETKALKVLMRNALADINLTSKINREQDVLVTEHVGETRNLASIHYQPATGAKRLAYSRLINAELRLRDLSEIGNLLERRERLRSALVDEIRLKRLTETLHHCTPREGALFLLHRCIPCILHLENRVGLKFLYMLLVEGLSNCQKGLLLGHIVHEGPRTKTFLHQVADIVNQKLIGTDENPGQWKCPYSETSREIGIVKLNNVKTRKCIRSLDLLIEVCIPDHDRAALWIRAVTSYSSAIEVARKREDYLDDDIMEFQRLIDSFFEDWVGLHGLSGCTNYIHMLSSGHVAEYMFRE